ncbi:hypothetical protein IGI04_016201 [Brassica rapa subsp. trilocularis]|uniref:DUF7792 domain-containing protein n=1 Tax=Brassica rapa subsp. trilocularis TaxID=1813537 RepID=A0ABQ7MVP5_BRACM|nr:hypothetical protein IGI04_016201 [Brassica rapa subsp. trilocularis]
MKQTLAKPIQLSDQVMKAADEASSFKQECAELKAKTEKLAGILCQVARDLYERPTHHIIDNTEQMLDQAFSLVLKCRVNGITKRVFTIIPSISDHIALLQTGSLENRSDAAASLISLTRDNDRYTKLIIVQRGIGPLLTAGEQVSVAAHFTCCCNSTREMMAKRVSIKSRAWRDLLVLVPSLLTRISLLDLNKLRELRSVINTGNACCCFSCNVTKVSVWWSSMCKCGLTSLVCFSIGHEVMEAWKIDYIYCIPVS